MANTHTCPIGVPIVQDENGSMVPFFVKTRDKDMIMTEVIPVANWVKASNDTDRIPADKTAYSVGNKAEKDFHMLLKLEDNRYLRTINWDIMIHNNGVFEFWMADPIVNFSVATASYKDSFTGSLFMHTMYFPLVTFIRNEKAIQWDSIKAVGSVVMDRSQEEWAAYTSRTNGIESSVPKFFNDTSDAVKFTALASVTSQFNDYVASERRRDSMSVMVSHPLSRYEPLIRDGNNNINLQRQFDCVKVVLHGKATVSLDKKLFQ